MPEVVQQPAPQPQEGNKQKSKRSIFKYISMLEIVIILLGLAYVGYSYTTKDKEVASETNSSKKKATDKESEITKKILEQKLPEEEIENIKNDQSDQKAGSSVREAKTAAQVCVTILQSENKPPKSIFTSTDGCADYDFLLSKDYLTKLPSDPKPVLKEDSSNSVICIWAKGGESSQNHWVLSATDNAKVISADNSATKVSGGDIKTFDLESDPKECQKS
ncbi:MAG TPA: hypothetical protein ENI13_01560 [candidate division CPR3 bacterium]|uniref:Uncharacterized protein n=1 Tax=candidate division CPR3 bacterium TaxID=2268181 RepID=A0A7C1NZL2_UNCC3|nr:hypothetical protein [candidate division CPR3 bacterium]